MRVAVAVVLLTIVTAVLVERYLNPWTVRGRWHAVRRHKHKGP